MNAPVLPGAPAPWRANAAAAAVTAVTPSR